MKLYSILPMLSFGVLSRAQSITTNLACYQSGQSIVVNFFNPNNHMDDWIAIYPAAGLNSNDLGYNAAFWLWSCGTQFCMTSAAQGALTFGAGGVVESEMDVWPLNVGTYVAVLSGGGEPYSAYSVSAPFTVQNMPCGNANGGGANAGGNDPSGVNSGGNNSGGSNPGGNDSGGTLGGSNGGNNPPPVDPVGSGQNGNFIMSGMGDVVRSAEAELANLIRADPVLPGKFLRLAFHDCVGGCDGCVDFRNPDNAGLVLPIQRLQPLVAKYEPQGLSRPDIWMLSAMVASNITSQGRRSFPVQWMGRKTCAERMNDNCGVDFHGGRAQCSELGGPHRDIPHADIGTRSVLTFFRDEFGFNGQQVVALMGAHSIGAMRRVNLGFNGVRGWDLSNNDLDHGYFVELVGSASQPVPDWQVEVVDNANLPNIPDRIQWTATTSGTKMVMLNTDICLVRDINEGENIDASGKVTCDFKTGGQNSCPVATQTEPHIRRYAASRNTFLTDFENVMTQLIEHGYTRPVTCPSGAICELQVA